MRESAPSLGAALRPFKARFGWGGLYFAAILLMGTIGYRNIEGWPLFDAFYMALTTIASVGDIEARPLSEDGRAFTAILILFGITGLGIWWALITAMIVELDLGGLLRKRRMIRNITELTGHFIVCGAGRLGRVVIDEMLRDGVSLVVIDHDPSRYSDLEEREGIFLLEGDATREQTLELAGIDRARGLAATLQADADNLLLCMTARAMSLKLNIVARAYDQETLQKLRRAGCDHPISPNITGGARMAAAMLRPSVVSFLDVATTGTGIELRLEQATVPEDSPLAGSELAQAAIPQKTGLIVLALRRSGGSAAIYNPGPQTAINAGDTMIVLGGPEQIQKLREHMTSSA